jgi:hypothetical protein
MRLQPAADSERWEIHPSARGRAPGEGAPWRRVAAIAGSVLVVLAVTACSKRSAPAQAEPAPMDLPKAAPATEKPASAGQGSEPLAPVPAVQRKLIQNAELEVQVKSYADARQAVDAELARVKGYLANAQIDHAEGRVSRAELSLRVPAEQLTEVLGDFKKLGTVLHESIKTQDITEEYVDLQARLSNARKLEARLLELLASGAKDVKDLLEVERELARVRETLERLEGKMKLFDSQVSMSTVTLRLVTLQTYQAGTPRGLGEQLKDTLGSSWQALVAFGRALLVVVVALLPWLPVLLAGGWVTWRLLRWLNRRVMARPRAIAAAGPYGQAMWMGQPVHPQAPGPAVGAPPAEPSSAAEDAPGAASKGASHGEPTPTAARSKGSSSEDDGADEPPDASSP